MVGGGNTAVEEALFLTNFASKVTVVHRKDEFRAEKILQERLFAHPKIEVIWDSAIDEVLGATDPMGVTGVRLKNVKTGATREIACDGVFIAIGHAPASELFKGQLEMDAARLSEGQARHDRDRHRGRLRRRRRHRRRLSPGGHRRRHGLHGRAGGRALPGRGRPRQGPPPDQPPRGGEDRRLVG